MPENNAAAEKEAAAPVPREPEDAGKSPALTAGDAAELLRKGVFRHNPVLVRALAFAPVLCVTTTLKNGVLLSLVTFVVLVVMSAAASLLYARIPKPLRAAVLTLIASAVATPLCFLANLWAPNVAAAVGIFLPLTAVNGIILSRAENYQAGRRLLPAVVDGAANGLGFALAVLVLSVVREAVGSGRLYDRVLPGLSGYSFSFADSAPGALMALAVLLAVVQFMRRRKARREPSGSGR